MTSFGSKLGGVLGTMVGAVQGAFSYPKTELDERAKRNKVGKAELKKRKSRK